MFAMFAVTQYSKQTVYSGTWCRPILKMRQLLAVSTLLFVNSVQVLSSKALVSSFDSHATYNLRQLQASAAPVVNLFSDLIGGTSQVLHTGVSHANNALQTSVRSGSQAARSVRQAAAEIANGLGEATGVTARSVVQTGAPLVRSTFQPFTEWASPIHNSVRNALRSTFNVGSWLFGFSNHSR